MSDTLVNWAKQAAIDLVSTPDEVRRRAEEQVEFGGYKFSGQGRECGRDALNNYLETKTVWVKLN